MRPVFVVPVLLLAACGSKSPGAAAVPTPSTSRPAPGPTAFLAFAHTLNFGTKDFASAPDDNLLSLGNSVCEGLTNGLTFAKVTQGLIESDAHPSTAEAEMFGRSAVANLCPSETVG